MALVDSPVSTRVAPTIGKLIGAQILVTSIAGVVLALSLSLGFLRLESDQRSLSSDAAILGDLARLEDSSKAWLVMNDLVYGSGETYLIEGAANQGRLIVDLAEALAASTDAPEVRKQVRRIADIVERNQQRLQAAENVAEDFASGAFDEFVYAWDVDAPAVIDALFSANDGMQQVAARNVDDAASRRQAFEIVAICLIVGFVLLIAALWLWLTRVIVRPLSEFTAAAGHALDNGLAFKFDDRGPAEVLRLTQTTNAFVQCLEDRVQERTTELREREASLVLEVRQREMAESKLKEALQLAERASRAKSEFLANMSHEVRTPLNGILGSAELLLSADLDGTQRAGLKAVYESGEHLLQIINGILDFSKLEAGEIRLYPDRYEPNRLLDGLLNLFSAQIVSSEVELIFDIDPDIPSYLVGDELRIRQVLTNLLANAFKFTAEGEVVLRARLIREGGVMQRIDWEVEDSGIGIPEYIQADIFRPFQQADGSTTRKYGGTGLGLSICKHLVELMGGDITVASQPGVGSRFTLSLPCEIPEEVPPPIACTEQSDGEVLLHIDNPSMLAAMRTCFRSWSWKTVCAVDVGLDDWWRQAADDTQRRRLVVADSSAETQLAERMGGGTLIPSIVLVPASARDRTRPAIPSMARLPCPVLPAVLARTVTGLLQGRPSGNVLARQNTGEPETFDLKVLVAEDNAVNQLVIRGMLQKLGCEVVIGENGRRTVDLFSEDRFDIVFMDWHMPELDGLEATRRIREWERSNGRAAVPIIALTANAFDDHADVCLAAGMDDFLTKPVALDRLSRTLRQWSGCGRPVAVSGSGQPFSGHAIQYDIE